MPSRFYQNAINLIVYLPSIRCPSEFMNVAMWEHCNSGNQIVGQVKKQDMHFKYSAEV
jgi:hypothetical protein